MKKLIFSLLLMTLSISAQTTSTALKAQIDTQITNKTGAGSITKTAVGNNIKAVVDYVDQQVPYKSYVVFFNQSGTNAPVVTELYNNLGNVVWTRSIAGQFTGTLVGGFPSAKTFFPNRRYTLYTYTDGTIRNIYMTTACSGDCVTIVQDNGNDSVDGLYLYLEIRVYN
jgi:hypothetical protein